METIHTRIKSLREAKGLSLSALADLIGVSWQTVQQWESGKSAPKRVRLGDVAMALDTTPDFLLFGATPLPELGGVQAESMWRLPVGSSSRSPYRVPLVVTEGTCGGGTRDFDEQLADEVIVESTFFNQYKLRPEHALAVYADGNAHADFIVDGDVVIFDTSRTEPKSGRIFLVKYPDGLRIKQLRIDIHGNWTLEDRNIDKRKYPSETVTVENLSSVKLQGEFVQRRGG